MNTYLIYEIICKPTKLSYIGYTGVGLHKRILRHLMTAYQKHETHQKLTQIQEVLMRYGIDQFKLKTLHDNIYDKNTADMLEMYYIKKHDTFKNGYNMTIGGEGVYVIDIDDREEIVYQVKNGCSPALLSKIYNCSISDIWKCVNDQYKYDRLSHIMKVYKEDMTYDSYKLFKDKESDEKEKHDYQRDEWKVQTKELQWGSKTSGDTTKFIY